MNNVLFLSSILPNYKDNYFYKESKGAVSNANDNLQRAIITGFEANNYDVSLLNVPNIGAFPSKFKSLYTPSFKIENSSSKGYNFGFFNLNILKHIDIYKKIHNYINNNINTNNYDIIFVYDLYVPFLKVLRLLKIKNPKAKIIVMIPDVIGFTNSYTSYLYKKLENYNFKVLLNAKEYIDGFVYLTKYMPDMLPDNFRKIPSVVVEGIFNTKIPSLDNIDKATEGDKFIFYAGSLDLRHGIMNLIDAFLLAPQSKLKLYICGDGDGRRVITDKIKNKSSVLYLGQLKREDVLKLQSKAFLLVNPRNSSEEFTKYSFPSKIMEYFGSGKPTFMYQLQGIPDEYFNYCYSLKDESVKALAIFIEQLSKADFKDSELIGKQAKDFVLTHKNPKVQVKRIIDLVNVI